LHPVDIESAIDIHHEAEDPRIKTNFVDARHISWRECHNRPRGTLETVDYGARSTVRPWSLDLGL
jgi:hypothetical protein